MMPDEILQRQGGVGEGVYHMFEHQQQRRLVVKLRIVLPLLCCSVLQRVAVCCSVSVLQRVAGHCFELCYRFIACVT